MSSLWLQGKLRVSISGLLLSMSTQRDTCKTMIIHILKDLAERWVSADESKKTMQKPQLLGQQHLQWLPCSVVREAQGWRHAVASGLSEALCKSPALSAAKEQRQKDFGTRPQTGTSTDQKQISTLRNKTKKKW